MVAALILVSAAMATLSIWGIRRRRGLRRIAALNAHLIKGIGAIPGGALVLVDRVGPGAADRLAALIGPTDSLLSFPGRLAVCVASPGRDAEFMRWLCRLQVELESLQDTVRIGVTRTAAHVWPEEHLARAERALAEAEATGTAVVVDESAPSRSAASEPSAIQFDAMPILCADTGRLVAVEPTPPPGPAAPRAKDAETLRHHFLARLRAGTRMLAECDVRSAGLSIEVPIAIAGDPDLHLALVFGLDGGDMPPSRVTLRLPSSVREDDVVALAATGCTISREVRGPDDVGEGPHWLAEDLVSRLSSDEAARDTLREILTRADATGAVVHATGVASPVASAQLARMGAALVSGPGVAPSLPTHLISSAQTAPAPARDAGAP